MGNVWMAFLISVGLVTTYYVAWTIATISVQKFFHYDKPQGLFYKIIDFPMALPGFIFDITVPRAVKTRYFGFKPGYFRRAFLCFILNIALYFVLTYFLLF